jgi:predicted alpha/beta-hydrolase family hydrolase
LAGIPIVKSRVEFVDNSVKDSPVRGVLHRPAAAGAHGLVLTHGAGSNCRSPLLAALAEAFCAAGWTVLRCDLPFRQARPHGPPVRGAGELDQAGLRAAVAALRRETAGRIYLGGHSYGGRQASMLAASDPEVSHALLLLSYPLHPPRRPDVIRTAHLPELHTPALFVHGTCDGFGTIAEMEEAIRLIPARTGLLAIAGAGHELMTRKNRGELPGSIARSFSSFAAG